MEVHFVSRYEHELDDSNSCLFHVLILLNDPPRNPPKYRVFVEIFEQCLDARLVRTYRDQVVSRYGDQPPISSISKHCCVHICLGRLHPFFLNLGKEQTSKRRNRPTKTQSPKAQDDFIGMGLHLFGPVIISRVYSLYDPVP